MPNYNLVSNARFQPFTFERYVQPYILYGTAYKEQENAQAELNSKLDLIAGKINEAADPETYNQYNNYYQALRQQADTLAREGLTPTSRGALLDVRSRYGREITPIEEAYRRREADIKRQQDALDKSGGRTVFTRDARTTSLDKYLNGTVSEYGQVNLDTVMAEGVAGAKGISSRYFDTDEGKAFGKDYYMLTKTQGLNPKEALKVIRRTGDYPEFDSFINSELAKVGATAGNSLYSEPDRQRIEDALMQGINVGIVYTENVDLKDNWRAKQANSAYWSDWVGRRAYNREHPTPPEAPARLMDVRNPRVSNDSTLKDTDAATDFWDKYKDFFYKDKDGNWVMTAAGRRNYKFGQAQKAISPNATPDKFTAAVDKFGLTKLAQGLYGQPENDAMKSFFAKKNNKFDAMQGTEYYMRIAPSDLPSVKTALIGIADQNGLTVYNRVKDKKTGSYKFEKAPDVLTVQDIKSDSTENSGGIAAATLATGVHGTFLEIKTNAGKRYFIPYADINTQYNDIITGNINDLRYLEKQADEGYTHVPGADGNPVSIDSEVTRIINANAKNLMNGIVTSKTKPTPYTRTGDAYSSFNMEDEDEEMNEEEE